MVVAIRHYYLRNNKQSKVSHELEDDFFRENIFFNNTESIYSEMISIIQKQPFHKPKPYISFFILTKIYVLSSLYFIRYELWNAITIFLFGIIIYWGNTKMSELNIWLYNENINVFISILFILYLTSFLVKSKNEEHYIIDAKKVVSKSYYNYENVIFQYIKEKEICFMGLKYCLILIIVLSAWYVLFNT